MMASINERRFFATNMAFIADDIYGWNNRRCHHDIDIILCSLIIYIACCHLIYLLSNIVLLRHDMADVMLFGALRGETPHRG